MHNAARRVVSGLDRLTEPHSSLREAGDMVLTTWTGEELNRIGDAEELQLASARSDGTLRPYVTMWVVRTGGEPYVRSAYGAYVTMWVVRAGDEP